jgi:hypothetical protein
LSGYVRRVRDREDTTDQQNFDTTAATITKPVTREILSKVIPRVFVDADLLVNYIMGGGGGGGGGVYGRRPIPVAGREAEEDRLCRVSRCQSERNLHITIERVQGELAEIRRGRRDTTGRIRRLLTCRR